MSFQEISAAEQLMKIAVNNQNHVDSLIGYYRDQIDGYNHQRAEWVIHHENLQQNSNDQYLLDQQINKQSQLLKQLKTDLALRTAELNAERQKYFKFLKDKEDKKFKLEESKKNYRELVNTCKPVNLNSKHLNNSSIYSYEKKGREESKLEVMKETGNSKLTNLELDLINIKKHHDHKRNQLRFKIDSLKEELEQLSGEYSDRTEQCRNQTIQALEKLCQLEKKHMSLTQQYFRHRMDNVEEQQAIQEQNQIIRLKNMNILQKLKSLEKDHADESKKIDSEVKKQNKEFKLRYDQELKQKEEHLTILKEQHERLQDIYLNKIKKLQEELTNTNAKKQEIGEKGKVEISSLKSQIKILRGRLSKEEIQQMREQIINEEEQSSQSLNVSELEKINKEVHNIEKQLNIKH